MKARDRYTATQMAATKTVNASDYRGGAGRPPNIHDPNGNLAVAAIHSAVLERHTNGLCRFVGDVLVLDVDPANVKGATP